jgi:hypothetical protein
MPPRTAKEPLAILAIAALCETVAIAEVLVDDAVEPEPVVLPAVGVAVTERVAFEAPVVLAGE